MRGSSPRMTPNLAHAFGVPRNDAEGSNNQPNFSLAFRATSALGVLVGGNLSRQAHGRQASMIATECVMSPLARFSGDSAGSAGESHEPSMNWIECLGSVRVSI